ncbi:energy transducer TonB, partial [Pseudomonas stutzeri]|nr:energy transducer TonB [Stutzerimonas stutzeri]
MISETRRRAYLDAMQVASWLPRTELPFAAPSRLELLQPPVAEPEPAAAVAPVAEVEAAPVVERPAVTPTVEPTPAPRPRIAMPEPKPVA